MNTKNKSLLMILSSFIIINSSSIALAAPTLEESRVEFEELGNDIQEINSKIAELDFEIQEINSELEDTQVKIENTNNEIDTAEKLLLENESDLIDSQEKLDARVRASYKENYTTNALAYLISSNGISDLLFRIDALNRIINLDQELIVEVEAKRQEIEKNILTLEESEQELVSLKNSIEENLSTVKVKKDEQEGFLAQLNNEKDAIFEVIEANEKQLVSNPISTINNSSSVSELQSAINTLNSLIPQFSSDYVINLAQDAIYKGNSKIEEANKPVIPQAPSNSPSNNNSSNNNSTSNPGGGIATYTMEATAYTGGTFTAMGLRPVRDPNGISTVAVDPNFIPLGSKVYVAGYGVAIASDTGGAVKGNIIDLYLNSYDECIQWGRRNVTVTLLAYPGEW